jgi:protein TonB
MVALRLPLAVSTSGLIGIGMFWVLWSLIRGPIDVGTVIAPIPITFSPPRIPTPVAPPPYIKVVRPPLPTMPPGPGITLPPESVLRTKPDFPRVLVTGGLPTETALPAGFDHDPIPVVRIDPAYPPSALRGGTEGWVKVQFSIAATGMVEDAIVIDSDPENVFEAAALKAIGRWRYDPKIENGVPVERAGMQTLIWFRLDE